MTVKIYVTSNDERKVEKNIENEKRYDCILKDSNNIKTPVIAIATSENIMGYNYAYIEEFNRFYFIDNINIIRNNYYELQLRCDVLMSYRTGIYNSRGIITRQENIGQTLLVDEQQPVYNYKETETKKFPYPIGDKNNLQFILTVAGSN